MSVVTPDTVTAQQSDLALAQAVAEERIGLFPQYFTPILAEFLTRLDPALHAADPLGLTDSDAVRKVAVHDVVDALFGLNLRTLISLFHDFRRAAGDAFDAGSSTAYEQFEQHTATAEFHREIAARYPVLPRLITHLLDRRVALLATTVEHLVADHDDLLATGLISAKPVVALRISDGDLHNDGQTVVFVETAEGGAVVHKPRPMQIEALAQVLLDVVNPHLRADCPLELAPVLTRTGHGWQGMVTPQDAADIPAARRFAYRMGAYSVVFAALGSTDLHCGNVIARGDAPVFVDLETLFQLRGRVDMQDALHGSAVMPVLETGLLPYQIPGALVDVDISGIGRLEQQTSVHTTLGVVDHRTDAVRLDRVPATVEQTTNLLRLAGKPVAVREFSRDFDAGVQDALIAVRHRTDRLREVILNSAFQVRQVMRPTLHYSRLLGAATHPDYLVSDHARTALLNRLKPISSMPHPMSAAVHALEVASLERGDVPFFAVPTGSTSLIAPMDGEVAGVFLRPPEADAAGVLDTFCSISDRQHRYLALLAVTTSEPDVVTRPSDDAADPGGYLDDLLIPGPGQFAHRIADLIRHTDVCPQSPAWMIPQLAQAGGSAGLGPATASLYDGGGIPLLLLHTGRDADVQLALAGSGERYLAATAPVGSPLGRSVFSGPAAAAYLLDEMATVTRDPEYATRRDAQLDALLDQPRHPADPQDLIGGLAGTVAFLCGPGRPDLVARHAGLIRAGLAEMRELLASSDGDRLPAWEFAHGRLGLAWAMARAGAATGDSAALASAAEHLHAAQAHWSSLPEPTRQLTSDASWCKGHAGALIALGEGLLLTGHGSPQVRRRLAPVVRRAIAAAGGRGRDLSPCHGATGVAAALLHLSVLLGAPEYAHQARDLVRDRFTRVRTEGYNGGLHRSAGSLSFMTGLTGMAHTCIVVTAPTVGSPLALTTTRGLTTLLSAAEGEVS